MINVTAREGYVEIGLRFAEFPGCCGGVVLHGYRYNNQGPLGQQYSDGIKESVRKCHDTISAVLAHYLPHIVLVAMDPVLVQQYGWDGGTVVSSCDHNVGASLMQFCKQTGFEHMEWSKGDKYYSRRLGVFSRSNHSVDGKRLSYAPPSKGVIVEYSGVSYESMNNFLKQEAV